MIKDMEKIVVISTNNNPDYYFYCPYMVKAWHSYGWKVAVLITHDTPKEVVSADYVIQLPNIEGLRTASIAQAGRLYAANVLPKDALIMTSDMDLLPLKDYWHPDPTKITNFGHDLTDHTFYPMGYTAMTGENWTKVMNLTGYIYEDMLRDSMDETIAHSPRSAEWEHWWNYDWSLLTKRLKPFEDDMVKVLRGRRPGSCFAYGRVDRGDSMQIPSEELIDAHCENISTQHPEKLPKFLAIFEKYHGKL